MKLEIPGKIGLKRIGNEFKLLSNLNPIETNFKIEKINECEYLWRMDLFNFPSDSNLYTDMKNKKIVKKFFDGVGQDVQISTV